MPILSQPAFGPKLSIGFITGGALLGVWTLVWRFTVAPADLTDSSRFWFFGFLLTGLTFFLIGAFLGAIGRAARKVELPPDHETTQAEAVIQSHAASQANAVPSGIQLPAMPSPAALAMPAAGLVVSVAPVQRGANAAR